MMKSKARIEKRIDYIKGLNDPVKALHELADLTYEIGEEACLERAEIRALTEKNCLMLIGNGNPNLSVIGRLLSVEEKVDDLREIKERLFGGVKQTGLSLQGRMDKFEDYVARSEKLQWFTLTAIVSYVIYQVLTSIF